MHVFLTKILMLFILSCPVLLQRDNAYAISNKANVLLHGVEQDFEFNTNDLRSRYNRQRQQFEFMLPLASVIARRDTSHQQIMTDLFFSGRRAQFIYITAEFAENLTNFEEYKVPREVELNSVVTIQDQSYDIPLLMSIMFDRQRVMYYSLSININLRQFGKEVPPQYASRLTGSMLITVPEGRWANFLEGGQ